MTASFFRDLQTAMEEVTGVLAEFSGEKEENILSVERLWDSFASAVATWELSMSGDTNREESAACTAQARPFFREEKSKGGGNAVPQRGIMLVVKAEKLFVPEVSLPTVRVLVADRSSVMCRMLIQALDQTGLAKWEFAETRKFPELKAKCKDADVLFLDPALPGMDFEDFARSLRGGKKAPGLPFIVLSDEKSEGKLKFLVDRSGALDCVRKPIRTGAIRRISKRILTFLESKSGYKLPDKRKE